MRCIETSNHAAAGRRSELGVRRHDPGVHDVDHDSGAEGPATILTIQNAVALIDPIEMPEEIGRRGIDGERKQNSGERSSQRGHLNFRTSWTTSNKIRAKRTKWQEKLLGVGG